MARAEPIEDWQDTQHRHEAGDWNALRSDLVALLGQVEQQMSRARSNPRSGQAFAADEERHRAALQSVNRALERFSARDGEELASAIAQIRGRHNDLPQRGQAPAEDLGAVVNAMSDRLDRMGSALQSGGTSAAGLKEISGQLAQLTDVVEMLAGAVGETGQVKRLEAQIANITRMLTQAPQAGGTELTQRLDRLASNIDQLTDLQKQFADRPAAQIEELSAAQAKGLSSIEAGVRSIYDRIDALEHSYSLSPADVERLSEEMGAISKEMANVTQYMKAGGVASGTDTILGRIDALNARIGQIEEKGGTGATGGLQADVDALRKAVQEVMEPQFSALTSRIDSLDRKVNDRRGKDDISVGQLEAQIRQLVARMDQTGEQLSDISKMYKDNAAAAGDGPDFGALADLVAKRTSPQFDALAQRLTEQAGPDLDALADLVAQRTSEAVSRSQPQSTGISADTLDELEARMVRLFSAQSEAAPAAPAEDFAGVHEGIRQVDERLARLETTLREKLARPADAAPADAAPAKPKASASPRPSEPAPAPKPAEPRRPAPQAQPDWMAANPSEDAPLIDKGFGPDPNAGMPSEDHRPETTVAPRLNRPPKPAQAAGAAAQPQAAERTTATAAPVIDPEAVERPRKPRSSLADDAETLLSSMAQERQADNGRVTSSRNTFIEAARRAAQRQQAEQAAASPQSLIARAFARFQGDKPETGTAIPTPAPAPKEAEAEKDDRASRKARRRAEKGERARLKAEAKAEAKRRKAEEKAAANSAKPEFADAEAVPESDGFDDLTADAREDEEAPRESFLVRHRQPILLVAAVIVAAVLLVNLIEKQMARSHAPVPGPTETVTKAPSDPAKPEAAGKSSNASDTIKRQNMLDPEPTGSVDPFVRMAPQTASALNQGLPPMLSDAARAMQDGTDNISTGAIDSSDATHTPMPAAEPPASGIRLDMPPEKIGPEALRKAAADGDPRAQFEVAAIYNEGQIVDKDLTEAQKWYERSAAQGFAPAEYRLGNLYEHGQGVAKNLEQAQLWYQRAAEAGNRMAMHNLAALYAGGDLGKQEFSQAAEWFQRAAERGLTDSQFNLGMLYARGLGVPQDLGESYKWFSLAAAAGDKGAAQARDDIAKSLDADAMKKVQDEIAGWKRAPIDIKANYAPIGTWADNFNPGKTINDKSVIEKVQEALNGLGYDVGIPDGLMGPRTRDAISAFEKATGMSESGAVNPRLLAVLGSQPV